MMMMMLKELSTALVYNQDDTLARLMILGDYLEEEGDPRAALVRLPVRLLTSVPVPQNVFRHSWWGIPRPHTPLSGNRAKGFDRVGRMLGVTFFLGAEAMMGPGLFGEEYYRRPVMGFALMAVLYNAGLARNKLEWTMPPHAWRGQPRWPPRPLPPRPNANAERFMRFGGAFSRARQKMFSGRLGDFNQMVPDILWLLGHKEQARVSYYFEELTYAFLRGPDVWGEALATQDGLFKKTLPVVCLREMIEGQSWLKEMMKVR